MVIETFIIDQIELEALVREIFLTKLSQEESVTFILEQAMKITQSNRACGCPRCLGIPDYHV